MVAKLANHRILQKQAMLLFDTTVLDGHSFKAIKAAAQKFYF